MFALLLDIMYYNTNKENGKKLKETKKKVSKKKTTSPLSD